jgi:protein-arginine kinase activator protein McsA
VQIYVAATVMDEASFLPEDEEEEQQPEASKKEKSKQTAAPKMSKLEQLRVQLKDAIEKENYEKAAALRDEIRKLELKD